MPVTPRAPPAGTPPASWIVERRRISAGSATNLYYKSAKAIRLFGLDRILSEGLVTLLDIDRVGVAYARQRAAATQVERVIREYHAEVL